MDENNKDKVLNVIQDIEKQLSELKLLKFGIKNSKAWFVSCLLIALNSGMEYSDELVTNKILDEIIQHLKMKIKKDVVYSKKKGIDSVIKILNNSNFKPEDNKKIVNLLNIIKKDIIPFINYETNEGEYLLNLFFTKFNTFAASIGKNQTYTPAHIADFMSDIVELSVNSKVLDPTCGSGSFLVQAMYKMLKLSKDDLKKREDIKRNQLFGIEIDPDSFGLATTNMLIHKDVKSNIMLDNCFKYEKWIREKNIDRVLMNPPFNAQNLDKKSSKDDAKGFDFVKYIANIINKGYLAAILPLKCAIGSSIKKNKKMSEIDKIKKEMLEKHNLVAVFSLPNELFYPASNVNTCIMLWKLGEPYGKSKKTYFGYYKDDGFVKKKILGRVEKEKDSWVETKAKWLKLFNDGKDVPGFSVSKHIEYTDEWLAETHMETNYDDLKEEDFIQVIRDFISFKIKSGFEGDENDI